MARGSTRGASTAAGTLARGAAGGSCGALVPAASIADFVCVTVERGAGASARALCDSAADAASAAAAARRSAERDATGGGAALFTTAVGGAGGTTGEVVDPMDCGGLADAAAAGAGAGEGVGAGAIEPAALAFDFASGGATVVMESFGVAGRWPRKPR